MCHQLAARHLADTACHSGTSFGTLMVTTTANTIKSFRSRLPSQKPAIIILLHLHYQPSRPVTQTVYCSANNRLKYYDLCTRLCKKKRNITAICIYLGTWDFFLKNCSWHDLSENGNNPLFSHFPSLALKLHMQLFYLNISRSANIFAKCYKKYHTSRRS